MRLVKGARARVVAKDLQPGADGKRPPSSRGWLNSPSGVAIEFEASATSGIIHIGANGEVRVTADRDGKGAFHQTILDAEGSVGEQARLHGIAQDERQKRWAKEYYDREARADGDLV